MQDVKNILAEIPVQLPEELFTCLVKNEQLRIERIVSRGHSDAPDKWYDQRQNEWLILLQGEAILQFEGLAEKTKLMAGDYLLIPAHKKHRVVWTDPEMDSVWLTVHF